MAKTYETIWDAQMDSIERGVRAISFDKAFWLLLKAKEIGAVSLESVWSLDHLTKDSFDTMNLENSTKNDIVFSMKGKCGIKHFYVFPKSLVNVEETWESFTRKANMFLACAQKYGYNAALKSL